MESGKLRSILIPLVTFCLIIGASVTVIAYGRGFRLDLKKNSLRPTGLISATSDPIGAEVFVGDKLKTATNNSFNIDPGWYTIRIAKEGYLPWQKNLRVQGEVVTRADAFLFPVNPSLSPLTTTGTQHPVLSPDGTKIAYTVPLAAKEASRKAGLWVLELADRPLGRNRDPVQIAVTESGFNVSQASLLWSPDGSEIMAIGKTQVRLYQVSRPNTAADITETAEGVVNQWRQEEETKDRQKLAAFPKDFIALATSSGKIISFSPDETKFLYEATQAATLPQIIKPPLIGTNPTEEQRNVQAGKLYVYDSREDRNYFIEDTKILRYEDTKKKEGNAVPSDLNILVSQYLSSFLSPLQWFPTNRHLILAQNNKIDIMEYDRTNWVTVYSGPFIEGFLAPWPGGSRLVILTNLNPGASTLPNLYTVNLR